MKERTLNYLGLTNYESKVYLFLVQKGTTKAVEISKKAGVPFGRIYDVLYQLEARGFVKVIITQPKQFSPIQPQVALNISLNYRKEQFNTISNQVKDDMQILQQEFISQQKHMKPIISMVSGEKNIKELRKRELINAKESINAIISPDRSTGLAPSIERLAREADKNGVKRHFIENPISKDEFKKVKMKLEGGAKIRIWPYKGFTLSIVDNKEVRIEVEDSHYGRTSVLIEQKQFAKAMNEFFNYKWEQAKDISLS